MYIKIYITPEEKQCLEAAAKMHGQPLSALCRERLQPLLCPTAHPPALPPAGLPPSGGRARMDKTVKVHLSAQEYAALRALAAGIPLSRYIRRQLLYRGQPVSIEVFTEDISILTMRVSGYLERFHSFISALAVRRQLCESDYQHLLMLAEGTRDALRDAADAAKANRKSIRSAGMRGLREEIKKALEDYAHDSNL